MYSKRIKGAINTISPSKDTSNSCDTSSSSNSSTNHNDGIVEGLIGFHNINGLALNPRKLADLLEWCHNNSFDFMGIAETNSNILNLQHYINNINADSSYEIQGSSKSINKIKGSGVALLVHSKWRRYHFDTIIFSPFLMVSKFGTKHRQLWIWVYYLPPTDQHTLQSFEQVMNNTTSDSHIIHIWMGYTNRHFDHSLDVHPSISDKKEDIPLCFHHLNLIDSFRFLNPEAKEFSWHQRSQDEALRIDTHPSDLTNYSQGAMEIVDKCWANIKEILISAAAHTLPLRKRTTLHPKLKPKDKLFDMKNLEKHTTKLSVFIYKICQYQATTPHDLMAFSRLKDKWDSQILLFNKDYADDWELQFDISFSPNSMDWLDKLKQVAHKRKKIEQKAYNSYQTNKITAAIEARFAIIQSDQTKWISSSLDRHKPNVIIDRLMVTTEDGL
ncbi:hypothetical protein RclHR1_22300005 [Rhizophagus clarus]|uniref:Endonuclease/exonuclease/phosphatase domain-containing protein n=1 Tax=Rhizophagus clarus TaxID=94130 RepID=A0A2Z6RNT9_9GLOM|nr:hypothetical protein RclHR1_22300005 [Rhizophagus clarus]